MSLLHSLIQRIFNFLSFVSPRLASYIAIDLVCRTRRPKRYPEESLYWALGRPVVFPSGCKGKVFGDGNELTIAVVHGWHSQGSRFFNVIKKLVDNNYRVLVWDGPAHGDSAGNKTHLPAFSKALYKDLSLSGYTISAIVSHSFGGAASAQACRWGLNVPKVILMSSPSSAFRLFGRIMDLLGLTGKARDLFVKRLENLTGATLSDMSSETFIEQLSQKIMVIHDHKDKIIPVIESQSLLKKHPSILSLFTDGYGHHRITDSELVNQTILDFIQADAMAVSVKPAMTGGPGVMA